MKISYRFFSLTIAIGIFIFLSVATSFGGSCELPVFDDTAFNAPIDNHYLSRDNIGYTYVYEAETDEGLVRDYIYFKPPADNVTILSVACTVVYDVEWLYVEDIGWIILEETDDWHAWDDVGNFWYFGEATEEHLYDDDWNEVGTSTDGSWTAGVDGAEPGIILMNNPEPGNCVLQEYYEDEAEDMGKVLRLNANISIDFGDYEGCLVTKEWTKLDPGNVEHKYYAPDLGLVYIQELKEKTVVFELVGYYYGPPVGP